MQIMLKLLRSGVLAVLIFSASGHAQSVDNGAAGSTTTESTQAAQASEECSASSTWSITANSRNSTCPSRTANYITHTLPQQCLRTDRTNATTTQSHGSSDVVSDNATNTSNEPVSTSSGQTAAENAEPSESISSPDSAGGQPPARSTDHSDSAALSGSTISPESETETDSPLDNANFLSFEEWKKQNLAKSPEHGRDIRMDGDRQRAGISNALDSLGEQGEIELDFSGFGGPASDPKQHQTPHRTTDDAAAGQNDPPSHAPRSKDAGKTCKERTNYASFDCAAQVMKNNPECKSPTSILVENKDSYMLNICSAQNKFLIIELCNDILVDTVVLANYEFFSSIFRHFRVSVSDRYPQKMDKWRDLGTFEARNTREIQAFLVQHPQIWARYLRIEFLTHYGSEYYCPLSLLRVHGTTMLEEIRPHEEISSGEGGEATLEVQATAKPPLIEHESGSSPDSVVSGGTIQEKPSSDIASSGTNATVTEVITSTSTLTSSHLVSRDSPSSSGNADTTEANLGLSNSKTEPMTCPIDVTPWTSESIASAYWTRKYPSDKSSESSRTRSTVEPTRSREPTASAEVPSPSTGSAVSTSEIQTANSTRPHEHTSNTTAIATPTVERSDSAGSSNSTASNSISASASSNSTNSTRVVASTGASSASGSSAAQPQPSTQESFFKSIHKRLQQLEANSTLSLQYIEEQSRILRDAFSKVEKRQISATGAFLTNLNETVMNELHGFSKAYDQLWQSTVIELEGQREQYQREMLAMSSRLTLVADELVWQKRMGIVQSTLLLLCLGLVLFARSNNTGYLEVPLMQQMMNKSSAALSKAGWESPPASPSPEPRSPVSLFRRKLWRSKTDPLGGRDGAEDAMSGTDSRPESKDGLQMRVNVEPPTPPRRQRNLQRESHDDGSTTMMGDVSEEDADDEEDPFLESRSSPNIPASATGERDDMAFGDRD